MRAPADFLRSVRPEGRPYYEFLLYTLRRPGGDPPVVSLKERGQIVVERHRLTETEQRIEIELLEIRTAELPSAIEAFLLTTLASMVEQGQLLAFFMFDGVFDTRDLFKPSITGYIYGFASQHHPAAVELVDANRLSPSWSSGWAAVHQELGTIE